MMGGVRRPARRPPNDVSPSSTAETTPEHSPRVAVIGAGAFGGWTALQLQRMGAHVTLFDIWGPGNSRSSSGGETRLLRGLYGPDRLYVQWVARSLDLWRECEHFCGFPLYQRTGVLWMFGGSDEYCRESLSPARELGFRVDALEFSEAERQFPQVRFEGVRTAYFEHEAGFLRARQACYAICEEFQREGGTYAQISASPGPIESQAMRCIELADAYQLAADQYVFACGPWLGRLFPEVLGAAIRPTRQEVYYFGAPSGEGGFDADQFPSWMDLGDRIYYGFPNVDRRGLKVADDTRGPEFDPTDGDRSPSPDGVARARDYLASRFPRLAGAPLLEARVCQYENSPDGHLIVDRHPEAANVWLVGGGSGHGFKLGPALGEHVARCVLGRAEPEPLFSISRVAGLASPHTQFGRPA
ncbi:MAG: FAD-dependent oxidoreductase [Acidobacteria bacterium]|nr:FAD-dependent oxidoreductase [Acidobacteriota bacterium]